MLNWTTALRTRTSTRAGVWAVHAGLVCACVVLSGCNPPLEEEKPPQKSRSLSELKQEGPEMSPEELAEARRKAGHKTQDEIAAEVAATFEKGAREWVKTRMPEYRALLASIEATLVEVEKAAPKWKTDADVEKFAKKYNEKVKAITKTYDTLTGKGAEGGETQVVLGRLFRTWEDFNGGLGPGVTEQEAFAKVLESIRADAADVSKRLDEIEVDDTLSPDPGYVPPKSK